jgi:hypothetical protein
MEKGLSRLPNRFRDELLEARDELLALAQQMPLGDDPRPHTLLHPLDEDAILGSDLPVQLLHPARIGVGSKEVVEEPGRTVRPCERKRADERFGGRRRR